MTNPDRLKMLLSGLSRCSLYLVVSVFVSVLLVGCGQLPEELDWNKIHQMIKEDFPGVASITGNELAEALAEPRPVILLDARESEEFDVSHLPGARRVTSATDALAVLETSAPDVLVVAYCSVGYRSAALVQDLQKQGVNTVVNLEGSIFAWANQGFPVYRGDMEVGEVHPFDESWGRLLNRTLWAFEPTTREP